MVEIFKTDVKDRDQANRLIDRIHKTFINYKANFDLEDCDRILRVQSSAGSVRATLLIELSKDLGINAELLPDVVSLPDLVRSASSKVLPGALSGFAGRPNR
jgi:hypothetical protein